MKLDGQTEAPLLALACSPAPEGRPRGTLPLLADKMVELNVFESISPEAVGPVLKNQLKPWLKQQWCIPPESNAEFV